MARPKNKDKDPVVTTPASVSPEFEEMVIGIAGGMERTKSWLGGRLMVRGYLALLEGENLLSEEAIKTITADKARFEHVLAHAKQLLVSGIPEPETFSDFYMQPEQIKGEDVKQDEKSIVG